MEAHQLDPLSTRFHSRIVRSAPPLRALIEPPPGSLPAQDLVLPAGVNDQRKPVVAHQKEGVFGQILRADPAGGRDKRKRAQVAIAGQPGRIVGPLPDSLLQGLGRQSRVERWQ